MSKFVYNFIIGPHNIKIDEESNDTLVEVSKKLSTTMAIGVITSVGTKTSRVLCRSNKIDAILISVEGETINDEILGDDLSNILDNAEHDETEVVEEIIEADNDGEDIQGLITDDQDVTQFMDWSKIANEKEESI